MVLDNVIPVDIIAQLFDLSTIFILLYITIKNISKIMSETKILVYMIFFMFYILPLVLDYVIGFPEYVNLKVEGFKISQTDTLTRIVYDICLLFCTRFILNYKPKEKKIRLDSSSKTSKLIYVFLIGGMLLPVFIVFLFNMPSYILVVPMWREIEFIEIPKNYSMAEQFDFVAICCCILCLFGKIKNIPFLIRLSALFLLYVNICIEGKRGIIFFTLMCIVLLWIAQKQMEDTSKLEKIAGLIKIAIIGTIIVIAMIIISINIKIDRGYEEDPTVMYTALRIDFLRDDRVRHAIFEILHPSRLKILDYPGQTIWPILFWIFPLNIFFSKLFDFVPLNYSYYLSCALMGVNLDRDESFMTPSILGELISNFSLLGIVFMALFTIWFLKKIESFPYPINIFLLISFVSWQMYPIGYIMLFLEFTLVLCVLYRIRNNTRKKTNNAKV